MKFDICKTSDYTYRDTIEINSLEELIKFQEKHNCIIISDSVYKDNTKEIEIYDDYRE